MRIGFISTYPPIECGIATYSKFLTDALRDLRQDVYVVSHFGGVARRYFPFLIMKTMIWLKKPFQP